MAELTGETMKRSNDVAPIRATMLIGGQSVDGPDHIEVRNPARPSDIVGSIVRAEPEAAELAIRAAKNAQPVWAKKSFLERASQLRSALDAMKQDIESRANIYTRENGKTLAEARNELSGVPSRQQLALSYAAQLDVERAVAMADGKTIVRSKPFGVVVSIVPWNSPVSLAFTQIVAGLLAGNAIVLKPPETCPLALTHAVKLFAKKLPDGVINLVTGLPSEIGDVLTSHPDVGKLAFTGSIPAARHIMANAAKTIKSVTLELGGNDPAIIMDDAIFDANMMKRMTKGAFQMGGQVCMAIKRIYVPMKRRDEFIEAFKKSANQIVIGDGLEPAVTMGPLHTLRGQQRVNELLEDAISLGAEAHVVGSVHDEMTFEQGYFVRPTLVTDAPDKSPLVADEQFGPILPILGYEDVGEAVSRANDSVYGLSASVWGRDQAAAMNIARNLEAGQVWINAHSSSAINHLAPYGGVKQSGLGRKSGIEGILEYIQSQTITAYAA